ANPVEALTKARESVQRALTLSPDLAEAHGLMGHITLFLDHNWAGSERHFLRAIELSPEPGGFTRFPYALWHLISTARWQEADTAFDSVIQLDPVNLNAWYARAVVRDCQGKVDEAVAVLERAMEIDSTNSAILRQLAVCLARQGQFDRAFDI